MKRHLKLANEVWKWQREQKHIEYIMKIIDFFMIVYTHAKGKLFYNVIEYLLDSHE